MNFLKSLFGGGPQVVCPRCLERISVDKDGAQTCPNCGWQLPVKYIKSFDKAPPLFVQIFGWTNHGKTLFLDTLRLVLMDMNVYWKHFGYESFTQLDVEKVRELRADLRRGFFPAGNQPVERNQNEVYIMSLNNMPLWQSRMLVVMDYPGEYFEDFSVPVKEIPFFINTPTTIMLISLPDVLDDNIGAAGESIDQLLQFYLGALENEGVSPEKENRKLVVVFTKADVTRGLPQNLRHYLLEDPVWRSIQSEQRPEPLTPEHVAEYLERMKRVSDDIQTWMQNDNRNVPGGTNFLHLLDRYNIDARFSIISATGGEVQEQGVNISPRRVLDPFFWALEFQSR